MLPPWLERSQRAALLATAFLFSAGYSTLGLVLVLLTAMVEGIVRRRLPWARSSGDLFLVSFIAVFLISGWVSQHRPIAVGSAGLAALTIYLAVGPLYRQLQGDRGFLKPFLWAWIAGGVLSAVWAITLHRLTGRPAFIPELGQNAVGTTQLIALMLGLGLFLTSRGIWQNLVAVGCAVSALGLALSTSRGAWLGAAAGLLSFLVLGKPRYTRAAALLLVLIGLVGFVFPGQERTAFIERVSTITGLAVRRNRFPIAEAASAIFRDHPVIGTGLNTFGLVYPQYRLPDAPNPSEPFAHNIFLNMAAEGGGLGLATFAAILLWAFVAGWQWRAASASPVEIIMAATILSTFLGVMVHQLFDGTLISVHLGTGLWFFVAILGAFQPQRRLARQSR